MPWECSKLFHHTFKNLMRAIGWLRYENPMSDRKPQPVMRHYFSLSI